MDVTRIVSGSAVSMPSTFTGFKFQSKRLAGAPKTLLSNRSFQSLPLASLRLAACLARPESPGGSPMATARMPEIVTRLVKVGTTIVRLTPGVRSAGEGELTTGVSRAEVMAVGAVRDSGVAVLGATVVSPEGDCTGTGDSRREVASSSIPVPHAKASAKSKTNPERLMESILQTCFPALREEEVSPTRRIPQLMTFTPPHLFPRTKGESGA